MMNQIIEAVKKYSGYNLLIDEFEGYETEIKAMYFVIGLMFFLSIPMIITVIVVGLMLGYLYKFLLEGENHG